MDPSLQLELARKTQDTGFGLRGGAYNPDVADDDSNARKQWEAINLELTREVKRLVDRHLLSESEKDKIWSDFRSAEERAFAQLYPGRTYSQLSTLERLRAG